MADFNIYATVAGAAVTAQLASGTTKIADDAWELERGLNTITPDINGQGFTTFDQDNFIPSDPRVVYSAPAPIYSENQFTFNFRVPPVTSDTPFTALGYWVTDPQVNGGRRTLMAFASQPTSEGPLFVVPANAESDTLIPIRGVILGLDPDAITLEDPKTYPIATADFPGNVLVLSEAEARNANPNVGGNKVVQKKFLATVLEALRPFGKYLFRNNNSGITASLASPAVIYVNEVDADSLFYRSGTGLPVLVLENVAANTDGLFIYQSVVRGLRLHPVGTTPTFSPGDDIYLTEFNRFSVTPTDRKVGLVLSGDANAGVYHCWIDMWSGNTAFASVDEVRAGVLTTKALSPYTNAQSKQYGYTSITKAQYAAITNKIDGYLYLVRENS